MSCNWLFTHAEVTANGHVIVIKPNIAVSELLDDRDKAEDLDIIVEDKGMAKWKV